MIWFRFFFSSICLLPHSPLSVSLSPFTVMEYFIDILGVWDRAMTVQLFYPFQMHWDQ